MATNNQSKLASQLIDLKVQYDSLLAAQKKFIKEGATSLEAEKKFGKSIRDIDGAIAKTNKSVQGYINAQSQRRKVDEDVNKGVLKLETLRNQLTAKQTAAIGQISALRKKEGSEEKSTETANIRAKTQRQRNYTNFLKKNYSEEVALARKKEREKTAEEKKQAAIRAKAARQEAKDKAAAQRQQQKGSIGFGLGAVINPAAIGRALGSVVKYLGAYQLLNAAIKVGNSLTIGAAKEYIKFEEALGKVAAVTGASGDNMAKLSTAIRSSAKETKFTAVEIGGLALSLAKLGATATDIPNLIQPITLTAQALGTDLAQTGEAILKVNNQFGLVSGETARSAQIITAAVNGSALSLDGFQTAMSYVGPIARQVGLNLQETASYMRVLADNGFQASKIGTGLRKVLLEVKKPGEDLTTTLERLAASNLSLSEAEKIAGKTGAAQLLTLTANIESVKILNDETYTYYNTLTSTAANMATTAGQVKLLESAYNDLQISIGETIVNSEFFLNLIGVLSMETEQLARAYKAIADIQKNDAPFLRSVIDGIAEGTIKQGDAVVMLLEKLQGESDVFTQFIQKALKETNLSFEEIIQLTGASRGEFGLLGRTKAEYAAAIKKVSASNKEFAQSLGTSGDQMMRLNKLIVEGVEGDSDLFADRYTEAKGYSRLLGDIITQKKREAEIDKLRTSVQSKFSADIRKVTQMTAGTQEAANAANAVSLRITKEKAMYDTKINQVKAGLIKLDEKQIENLNVQSQALQAQLNLLSEYAEDQEAIDAARKEREKQEAKNLKALNDAIKSDKKRVQEEVESRKELLKSEKELYDLRIAQASNSGDSQEAMRLNAEYTALETKANEDLAVSIKAFEDKWTQAYVTIDGKKLRNVLDGESVTNEVDQLKDSINELAFTPEDIKGWLKDIQDSISSVLEQSGVEAAKEAADATFYQMMEKMKSLNVPQEVLDVFQSLFTLTIYPKIDDQAVKEATELQKQIDKDAAKREKEDNDFLNDQRIKQREDFAKQLEKFLGDSAKKASEIYQQQQDADLEALKARLEVEKQLISDRSEYETKVLDAQIQNQLISQEEYAARLEAIKRKEIQQQNAIDKRIFEAEQKRDTQKAKVDLLEAIASIIPNLIIKEGRADPATLALMSIATTALATASYASEITAINKRKFYPKKFAEGGVVNGPSHANGGVPFTINGMGGYEMEGGEYIVNKYSTNKYKSLLDQINGTKESNYKFASGGIVSGQDAMARQLEYLEAIAEATVNTAINVSKPVRAFVSSDDISKNETARRLKERNRNL